ncbi:hypothetical protein DCC81_02170 [Chitinophaga parva]|uniref:AB hydrolase-1 domain-containing protein n=1 Tax=Chitinophaga parva TaxID=2169414 RepID=A0A2T7BKV3_9BACT|nr:alpha/beta hydrolase [Chitinophaga parva]PUZ28313.1 hypothetical protein DCC81_02170 [Chitinophaga parva]
MHTHTVAVPGCNLHYTVSGSGAPLLLIPALGGEAWWYHKLLPVLATHFTVITYDQRGCGQSAPSAFPSCVSTQSHDALSVLQAAGEEAAHVVGLSSGGAIALDLARQAGTPLVTFPGHHLSSFHDAEAWSQRLLAHLQALA